MAFLQSALKAVVRKIDWRSAVHTVISYATVCCILYRLQSLNVSTTMNNAVAIVNARVDNRTAAVFAMPSANAI